MYLVSDLKQYHWGCIFNDEIGVCTVESDRASRPGSDEARTMIGLSSLSTPLDTRCIYKGLLCDQDINRYTKVALVMYCSLDTKDVNIILVIEFAVVGSRLMLEDFSLNLR